MTSQTTQYWASQSPQDTVSEAEQRITTYYRHLNASNRLELWQETYTHYHRNVKGYGLISGGTNNEFTLLFVNHFRNFLQHLMNLTSSQRPAFEPRAVNTDSKSQIQVKLAKSLLDYYLKVKRLDSHLVEAVEYGLLFGEAYLAAEWDATVGTVTAINPDTNQPEVTGEIEYGVYSPLDVIRDIYSQSSKQCQWYIIRKFKNKFDLAAKYPELKDRIISAAYNLSPTTRIFAVDGYSQSSTDLVPVYTLYHDRTPAMPDGRMMEFIDSDVVLLDGPLPYPKLPLYKFSGADQKGTSFGYSVMFDMIPIQEAVDSLYSTIMTNQEAFGVTNIAVARGSGISVSDVGGGMRFIEYDSKLGTHGIPQPLNLTSTPPEIFNFLGMLEHVMETISGINSVARGNPEASLKSGAALALIQQQAVQFSQGLVRSYVQLVEDVGQATVDMLKSFATTPRQIEIVGRTNRSYMRDFTSQDIQLVNRVMVDIGSALQNTTAGKVELATNLLQSGLIKTPEQYLQVVNTGNLDVLTEGQTSQLINIHAENEELLNGNKVAVMILDDHKEHIMCHYSLVADPATRADAQLVQVVTDHIMEHYKYLSDPSISGLLTTMGQQPAPPMQAAPPTPSGGQPINPAEISTAPLKAPPGQGANEMAASMQPKQPRMPTPAGQAQPWAPGSLPPPTG